MCPWAYLGAGTRVNDAHHDLSALIVALCVQLPLRLCSVAWPSPALGVGERP